MGTAVRRYLPSVIALALAAGLLPLGSPPAARAAGSVSLAAANVAYTENFDTLANTGTANTTVPAGWDLVEAGGGARDNEQYAADTGSSGTGDTYSYGGTASTERAFGGLQSGTLIPTIGASFTNDTGVLISALAISYVCEMWRAGVTNRGTADRLDFELSTDATSLTTGTWTSHDSLDCNSPNILSSTNGLDGNAPANQASISATLTGLSIAAGSGFWLRWSDFNITSSDDGLALDGFSLTPNPTVPTDPSGVGDADPAAVLAGGSTLLTVTVTPGTNPSSSGLAVEADLTAIGGSASQAFFDDASNGDATSGDNVFSFQATVDSGTLIGSKLLPFTIGDDQARTGTGDISLSVVQLGDDVVISEFRTRGPSGGNDEFVEIYNRSADPVDISGWLLRASNSFGTTGTRATVAASTVLGPGCYFLFTNTAASGYSGAVAGDQSYTTGITDNGGLAIAKPDLTLTDQAGMSAGSAYGEGTRLAQLTTNVDRSYERRPGGPAGHGQDTDDNSADFAEISPSNPQNSDTHCVGAPTDPTGEGSATPFGVVRGGTTLLEVTVSPGTDPASTGLAVVADLTAIGGPAAQPFFDDASNGDAAAGDNVFSYLATVDGGTAAGFKTIPFTVSDAEARSTSDDILMAVVAPCGDSYTPTFTLQGSGASTTMSGFQETEAVVIGDYQGGSTTTLRGIYIQDQAGDGDAATSDGLFVFNGGPTQTLALGDRVRVSGNIAEFQGQTQISTVAVQICSSDHDILPTDVNLPVPAPVGGVDYLERVEGMLVRFNQTLYVTEHFQLGRFGQITMSSGNRLQQPTAVVDPGAPANAMQAANNLNRIIVDDDSQAQNPDPILFGRGGNPLSASNTLRGGDTASDITGVMTWTWAGNHGPASVNAWRIRPVSALHAGIPDFQPTNPRPETRPDVGGTVQVGALNLLNYFNTFTGCIAGVGAPPDDDDCRGAFDQAEFDRQWPKTVAAILGMDVDVLGIMEIENDGYGPSSAIAHLVDRLNEGSAPGTYAFIDADAATGQVNALGTDAIKVGLIYRPADVTPVGVTAVLNSAAFVNGGDAEPRNRPSLAQAFSINGNGGIFVVDVNHLKSKGSACAAPDAGDGQGNCNVVRTISAELLADWLAADPTGTGASDVLIVGDLNSYAREDPIGALEDAGYTNLINAFSGSDAFSYVFDGQWGYLDHALGSPSATSRVTGVVEWHINADEPSVLDYTTSFKSAGQLVSLYEPDQYRMSDHDPVIVGLDYSLAFAKAQVLAALEELLAATTDEAAAERLAEAIERLDRSLTPEWWIDGDRLSLSEGQKVFSEEKKVVQHLTSEELADNPVAQQLVDLILDIDRELALNEVEAAEAADGNAKDIADAWAELERGDQLRADGMLAQAVDAFRHAWQKARSAWR